MGQGREENSMQGYTLPRTSKIWRDFDCYHWSAEFMCKKQRCHLGIRNNTTVYQIAIKQTWTAKK